MGRKRNIAIFGGSFNPVHIGHMMLANYLVEMTTLDEVWLTLSPQNPLKAGCSQASDRHRYAMLQIACGNSSTIKPCDIELSLPRPSYTVNTLRELQRTNPDCDFKLIIGGDNLAIFDRWREHEAIINDFGLIVYPRPGYDTVCDHPNVTIVDAPMCSISSTMIRNALTARHDMTYFMPDGVYQYIKTHHLYEK